MRRGAFGRPFVEEPAVALVPAPAQRVFDQLQRHLPGLRVVVAVQQFGGFDQQVGRFQFVPERTALVQRREIAAAEHRQVAAGADDPVAHDQKHLVQPFDQPRIVPNAPQRDQRFEHVDVRVHRLVPDQSDHGQAATQRRVGDLDRHRLARGGQMFVVAAVLGIVRVLLDPAESVLGQSQRLRVAGGFVRCRRGKQPERQTVHLLPRHRLAIRSALQIGAVDETAMLRVPHPVAQEPRPVPRVLQIGLATVRVVERDRRGHPGHSGLVHQEFRRSGPARPILGEIFPEPAVLGIQRPRIPGGKNQLPERLFDLASQLPARRRGGPANDRPGRGERRAGSQSRGRRDRFPQQPAPRPPNGSVPVQDTRLRQIARLDRIHRCLVSDALLVDRSPLFAGRTPAID